MKIRNMQIEDYEAIYQLWLDTPGMGLNKVDDSREDISRFLRRNPATCFIAEIDDRLSGVILCGHDGRRAFIYHLAVVKSHQRKGIGKALLGAAMNALEAEGIAKAALVVFRSNVVGNTFWENQGFQERGDLVYRNKAIKKIEYIIP
jgi:ribosomal protein S18 acetylase RimI-like enzyme